MFAHLDTGGGGREGERGRDGGRRTEGEREMEGGGMDEE